MKRTVQSVECHVIVPDIIEVSMFHSRHITLGLVLVCVVLSDNTKCYTVLVTCTGWMSHISTTHIANGWLKTQFNRWSTLVRTTCEKQLSIEQFTRLAVIPSTGVTKVSRSPVKITSIYELQLKLKTWLHAMCKAICRRGRK